MPTEALICVNPPQLPAWRWSLLQLASKPPNLLLTGELTATLRGDSVLLHNGSTERVHFALNGEEDPNRVLWQLCAGPDCPGLETGADDALPLAYRMSLH